MDTTETYSKMCEKAEEIQNLAPSVLTRIHLKGNICLTSGGDSAFYWCMDSFEEDSLGNNVLVSTKSIWLPRQDQLQEMLTEEFEFKDNLVQLSYEFSDFTFRIQQFTSFEQRWLAFVMKEKYQKVWKGGEWIKE